MHPVLKEIYQLHPQSSLSGAILMAMRARVEHKMGIENRIGGGFDLPKSVFITGPGGTGKTHLMRRIIDGFGLENKRENGSPPAVFHKSLECSTVPGIRDLFRMDTDAIHFCDEMSLETPKHIALIKQIANGEISYPVNGEDVGFPFTGMIIAAANRVKAPANYGMQDMIAMFQRFIVVKARPTKYDSPEQQFRAVMEYNKKKPAVNFKVLKKAMYNTKAPELNKNEKELSVKLWVRKSRESLVPPESSTNRFTTDTDDVVKFVKRITGSQDITKSPEIVSFARIMVDECVTINPTAFLSSPQERVYETIKELGSASFDEIQRSCRTSAGGKNAQRVLDQLMNFGLIYRGAHSSYSNVLEEESEEQLNLEDAAYLEQT